MTAFAIEVLGRLQEIDKKRYDLEFQKEALPAAVAEHRSAIDAKQNDLAKHHEQIKKRLSESHNQEVELQGHEEVIAKLKGQLNTAASNKEYSTLLHQIEVEKIEIARIEDAVLEIMADTEILLEEQKQLEKELEDLTAHSAALENRCAEQVRQIEEDLNQIFGERSNVAANVDPPLLAKYERVLKKHSGSALAPVVNEACRGCHMTITHQELNLLLGQDHIVFCRSCNRILYLPEETG